MHCFKPALSNLVANRHMWRQAQLLGTWHKIICLDSDRIFKPLIVNKVPIQWSIDCRGTLCHISIWKCLLWQMWRQWSLCSHICGESFFNVGKRCFKRCSNVSFLKRGEKKVCLFVFVQKKFNSEGCTECSNVVGYTMQRGNSIYGFISQT